MSDLMRSFLIAASGALLPAIAGTILANHRCLLSKEGCVPEFNCTDDSGHCNGASVKKKGEDQTWGVCVTRTGLTCTTVANQACAVEKYYSDSGCNSVCEQSYTTTPTGCNG